MENVDHLPWIISLTVELNLKYESVNDTLAILSSAYAFGRIPPVNIVLRPNVMLEKPSLKIFNMQGTSSS
jgi:hypothetical protein